jgi:hypothetical protein
MALEGIDFKGMVIDKYKSHDNEFLRIVFSVFYNGCVKILRIYDL